MSATRPNRCTGTMARVRGVTARATAAGSRLKVAGSMSTNTGVAPSRLTVPAVAKNEYVERDHLVAGPDAERHQRGQQGVGPRRQADGVRHLEPVGQLVFEGLDFGTEDEALAVGDAGQRVQDLPANRAVLCLQVEQRNGRSRRLLPVHAPIRPTASRCAARPRAQNRRCGRHAAAGRADWSWC